MNSLFKNSPVQPAGWVVFAVGVASLAGALLLGWRELLVLAIGCAAILLLSVGFIIGRSDVRLARRLVPDRVTIGEKAVAELHAANRGSGRSPRQTIQESMNGRPVPIPIPALKPEEQVMRAWEPPTNRRGVHLLGPARITKADPCRLMQRDVGQTAIDELWVQPRVVPLPAFAGGLTKDMDGPTFDYSPAGDVAFHAIRPYRIGDDARHVHWMATARAGEMMVRHYVDNRQPYLSVIIDTNIASWASLDEFDEAINIAASLGVSSLERSQPVSVHAGSAAIVGRQFRTTRKKLLDDLTLIDTDTSFDLGGSMGPLVAAERTTTVALILTGSAKPMKRLASATSHVAHMCSVMLVSVGGLLTDDQDTDDDLDTPIDEDVVIGRGVRFARVADVDDFAKSVARQAVSL